MVDGPSIEADWQHWKQMYPGEVQVVGVDLWNQSASQNQSFQNGTGITFPLLLNGGLAAGGNFYELYGTYDNFIVINKQRIVRYHAYDLHPTLGNRYFRAELRATVDSLVTPTVDVGDGAPGAHALAAGPNPFAGTTTVTLSLAARTAARLTVHDVAGRRIATLWEGPLAAGAARFSWDGRAEDGAAMAAGVYLVRAELGDGTRLTRRLVRLP